MYAFDCLILLAQILFFNTEQVLYGLLLILIYTVVLNKVLLLGTGQMQVTIISRDYPEISREIQKKLDRGTTLLKITGGYREEEAWAVLTVVSGRELPKTY